VGDFWSLTQQAGPLRWPIFVVLGMGLIQVFQKLYELLRDRRVSAALYSMDVTTMTLEEIVRVVEDQEESMLSSLQSTMLNVFQTRPGEGLLHDEIANFVSFKQDQFSVFHRRMEFLSDTAGALGLMGTVWGMFTVFFQGTTEQDVILQGMGIALITTLLGLVVSIILNFSATELSTFFGKRLEQVSRKSHELRFRLMELAPKSVPPTAMAVVAPAPVESAPPEPPASVARQSEAPAPPAKPVWHYVEMENGNGLGRAGAVLADFGLIVKDAAGKAAPGVPIIVAVPGTKGDLGGGERSVRRESDGSGRVGIDCSLPESVGPFALEVSLPDQAGPSTRFEVGVHAAEPHAFEVEGNNQAAVAGMKLPLPMAVLVSDRFGNPVAGVPVGFAVTQGGGQLALGTTNHEVATDASGRAVTTFVVASDAGQNGVRAVIEGSDRSVDFIAFGTQA